MVEGTVRLAARGRVARGWGAEGGLQRHSRVPQGTERAVQRRPAEAESAEPRKRAAVSGGVRDVSTDQTRHNLNTPPQRHALVHEDDGRVSRGSVCRVRVCVGRGREAWGARARRERARAGDE